MKSNKERSYNGKRIRISFGESKALKKILKDNPEHVRLTRGPLGHYWFDTDLDFSELTLPDCLTYEQHLFSENGGGQYLIFGKNKDEYEQLGRIDTKRQL